jgi:hypothetical protein
MRFLKRHSAKTPTSVHEIREHRNLMMVNRDSDTEDEFNNGQPIVLDSVTKVLWALVVVIILSMLNESFTCLPRHLKVSHAFSTVSLFSCFYIKVEPELDEQLPLLLTFFFVTESTY